MKKEKIFSFNLIRFIAMICILLFHFILNGQHVYPEQITKNYDLAQIGVSLFFILSGAALYYNYHDKISIKEYYTKRFLSIFPYFYTAYVMILLFVSWNNPGITDSIPKINFLFSLIGMDSLLGYKFQCLSLTGEWFIGSIIIIYIIYPLLKKAIDKFPFAFLIISAIFFILFNKFYNFEMNILYNPFNRIFEFIFGMFYIKKIYKKDIDIPIIIISILSCFIFIYTPLSMPIMYLIVLGGISLFTLLMELGKIIKNNNIINIINLGSKYSFCIFLVHHYIANYISYHYINFNLSITSKLVIVVMYFLFVFLFAFILMKITNIIMNALKKSINYNNSTKK